MTHKPSHEELEKRIKELEKEALMRKLVLDEANVQRETLARVFEIAPCIMMLVDKDCRVSNINQKGVAFLSRPKDALLGLLCGEVFSCLNSFDGLGCGRNEPCLNCPVRTKIVYTLETGESIYDADGRMTVRKGSTDVAVDVLISTALVKDRDANKVLVTITDITERKRAEEALRESENKFKSFAEQANTGINIIQDGVFKYVNPKFAQMFGYTVEECLNDMPFKNLVYAEDLATVEEQVRRQVSGEAESVYETFRGLKKNGQIFPVEIYGSAIIYQGKPATAGTILDITERKQVEEFTRLRLALLEFYGSHSLEELIQKTMDEVCASTNSPIGFYFFVESDQTTISLQAWSTRTLKEFCKSEWKGAHYPIEKAGVWADCVRERRPVIHNDYPALPHRKGMPEGHAEVIRELIVPIMRSGRVVAILGIGNKPANYTENDVETVSYLADVAWEITERKRAEEALRETTRRLENTLGSISDAFFSMNDNLVVTYFNAAAERMLNRKASEVLGKHLFDAFPEARGSVFDEKYHQAVAEKVSMAFETYFDVVPYRNWYDVRVYPHENGISVYFQVITESKRAQEALSLRESYLTAIIENQPGLLWLKDKERRFLAVNHAFARSCGMERPEEVLGKTDLDIWPKELAEKYRNDDKAVMTTGVPLAVEEPICDQGEMKWFETFKTPVLNKDGQVLGTSGYAHDITERRNAEQALHDSEQRLSYIIDFLPDATLAIDKDRRIIIWNRAIEEMTGIPAQEMLGKGDYAYTIPFYGVARPQLMDLFWIPEHEIAAKYPILKREGENLVIEVFCPTLDGGRGSFVWAKASPLRDSEGRLIGAIECIRDITERKRAEDALRESEERFSKFFRSTPVGTSITRLSDGQILDANDAFLGLYGYTREEAVSHSALDLGIWANPEDRAKMVEVLQKQGRMREFETQVLRKSGEIMDVLLSAEVIEMAGEQYILNLSYDITERKRAEEGRKKLEDQLFQAQKMESVGRLAGGVAHDFNNMLGVIIGRAEMALEQDVPTDKLQHNLKEILIAGQRSAELTRQLLAFARKQTAIPRILDLNGTISGMIKMLRRLITEDIDLSWQPGPDLWKIKIDPSQVDQILANLVVNARDAISGVGAITMSTENVVIDDSNRAGGLEFIPGEYVLLTVGDTGAGMSQEVCENIFEPFFTTKEVGKGTGLGLSTVYGIVKQNDG